MRLNHEKKIENEWWYSVRGDVCMWMTGANGTIKQICRWEKEGSTPIVNSQFILRFSVNADF